MEYLLQNKIIKVKYDPEKITLSVATEGNDIVWSWADTGKVRLSDGAELDLANFECKCFAHNSGTIDGVRASYSGFFGSDGQKRSFTVETFVGVDEASGQLRTHAWLEGDERGEVAALVYPPRIKFDAKEGEGYTVLPRMQGTLVPAGHPIDMNKGATATTNTVGYIYERDGYMPLFGQVHNGCGYAAIYETPYDARYELVGEEVQPYFVPSLGLMSYKREMIFTFFAEGDFNTIAKIYRAYRAERGRLVTLGEKIAKNPSVEYLIGTPVVHTGAAVHIHPESFYYDAEHPENNDWCNPFEKIAIELHQLKEKGAERAYVHLDGWGHHGYDNLHPSPFPINEQAGGTDGMRALQQTCHALGYKFGLHDQYRDYYYDSPGFSIDNAAQNADGGHFYGSIWYGGPHSLLCARLAPDFVRRNYDEFERLGIKIDGSYLDVFSVVELDECFNPNHPMTREDCAKYRRHCLDVLTSRGIIPSSEEVLDCIIESMALCHHAPFACTSFAEDGKTNMGVPIPLFNLVYHDCIVIPWGGLHSRGTWSIADSDSPYLWALLCGGTIYFGLHFSQEDIEYGKIALELHRNVALSELTSHEILDQTTRKRRSTFSDGTVVEADFDSGDFCIKYPDGRVVCGRD